MQLSVGGSAWTKFFNCGDDRDFMMLVGLDRRAFAVLLVPFSSEYDSHGMNGKLVTSKYASHGNRVSGAAAVLGLVMHYLCSKAEMKYLCMIFGVTVPTFSRYLHFGSPKANEGMGIATHCSIVGRVYEH